MQVPMARLDLTSGPQGSLLSLLLQELRPPRDSLFGYADNFLVGVNYGEVHTQMRARVRSVAAG